MVSVGLPDDCHGLPPMRTRSGGTGRRAVLVGAAVLGMPMLSRGARAAPLGWRIGHSAPADFPLHLRLLEAASAISAHSEGRLIVDVHPNGELGSPVGLLTQVRAGTIDAAPLTAQVLAGSLGVSALPTVGFAFSGYDQLWPALDGQVGALLRDQFDQRLGLVAMKHCWDFGFRQVTTNGKVVHAAADMAGLRLRTPPEADFIGLLQALQALPLAMPLGALEGALRSRAADGQEGVLLLVKAAGLFRLQSVCSLTNHAWDGQWMCVSGKSWSKLPADLKDMVAEAFAEAALRQRQDTADAEIGARRVLEAAGMTFNTVDPASFRVLLGKSGYYAAWRRRMGDDAWAVLEKYTGRLT